MTAHPAPVTVLGLGAMGSALARAFLAAGHPTTVWNRSSGRAEPLTDAGVSVVADLGAAVRSSALVVVCLLDPPAVLHTLRAVPDLTGRTVVNLTSSTPEDARMIAERVVAAGGRYVDGTVMVPTPLVGTAGSFVLYSGDPDAFDEHRATLESLGGELEMLGADPGRAAMLDLGMLDVYFAAMTSFLHAAALVGTDGVTAAEFLPYARRIVGLLDVTFAELARDVDTGEHPGDADNLAMELVFLDHILATSRARGIDTTVPGTSHALVTSALGAGNGKDGYSRIIDSLRTRH